MLKAAINLTYQLHSFVSTGYRYSLSVDNKLLGVIDIIMTHYHDLNSIRDAFTTFTDTSEAQ